MGNRDRDNTSTVIGPRSDSGYGDDASVAITDPNANHPLGHARRKVRKGYEIGPASNLQVGDVFEFLWADSQEFEWEWKCLGYVRFIVLRHSDTFPSTCACIPISVGSKHDFAKPGIDTSQQGAVFADGDRSASFENSSDGSSSRLPYSPIGVELRSGKFRVKEDSRANYADIIEVDHDAQVMVIGSVARYFDRVRRNVNKAYMRHILKKALQKYRDEKAKGNQPESNLETYASVAAGAVGPFPNEEAEAGAEAGASAKGKEREGIEEEEEFRGRRATSRMPPEPGTLELPASDRRISQGLSQLSQRDNDFDPNASMHNVAMAGLR